MCDTHVPENSVESTLLLALAIAVDGNLWKYVESSYVLQTKFYKRKICRRKNGEKKIFFCLQRSLLKILRLFFYSSIINVYPTRVLNRVENIFLK